ncbi:MAG: ABC transporter permease [Chitinophagales bacterium]
MKKTWLIIQREYITRVRKKSFIIITLLAPFGFALFFLAAILISGYSDSKKRVAVIDNSGLFEKGFKDSQTLYFFKENKELEAYRDNFQEDNYDGILFIPPIKNMDNPRGIMYISNKQLGLRSLSYIEAQIKENLKNIKIEQANLDKDFLRQLENIDVRIESKVFGAEGEEKSGSTALATVMGYVMGFIIYIALFIYGSMVMKGVMEEKTNRVVEVMSSSVKPIQLMLGKIIGVGGVGLTQFLLWGVLIIITQFGLTLMFSDKLMEMSKTQADTAAMGGMDPEEVARILESLQGVDFGAMFLYFIFFFVFGYLIYGALFAAIGAASNDDGDMQSLNFIVSIPIIASIFIMTSVIQEPESGLAFWGSIIPFTSPIVMMARLPFGPATWEILLSMLCLVLGFLGTVWIAGRIYRTGILLYGKKVSLLELGKWIFSNE